MGGSDSPVPPPHTTKLPIPLSLSSLFPPYLSFHPFPTTVVFTFPHCILLPSLPCSILLTPLSTPLTFLIFLLPCPLCTPLHLVFLFLSPLLCAPSTQLVFPFPLDNILCTFYSSSMSLLFLSQVLIFFILLLPFPSFSVRLFPLNIYIPPLYLLRFQMQYLSSQSPILIINYSQLKDPLHCIFQEHLTLSLKQTTNQLFCLMRI